MTLGRWILPLIALVTAAPAEASDPFAARVRTDDVDRFFTMLDKARGTPDAATIQRDYLDSGSPGVREFIPYRIKSAAALAATIAAQPAVYERARQCRPLLTGLDRRMRSSFLAFQQAYPQAILPDVTILVGRNNSGGTAKPAGVLIGLEVICDPTFAEMPDNAAIGHIIAHELGHTQQKFFTDDTLLAAALNEGIPEFIGELISGKVSNADHATAVAGREEEFERSFVTEMRGKDRSRWLYNRGTIKDRPGDLGYWVGYRIARHYYDHATDKRAAIKVMLESQDAEAFLKLSGWKPGA